MKDTQITRVVYGDNYAFKKGVEVGRKEMIEKALEWFRLQKEEIGLSWFVDYEIRFREAMED